MATLTRTEKLDFRISAQDKSTLSRAAELLGRSVSEFVLESALARAEEALPDRQRFGLSAERWYDFLSALEAPTRPGPRLAKLGVEPSVFEIARSG